MCNEAYRRTQIGQLRDDWHQLRVPLRFPEGIPNFAALEGFKITDRVEIIRPAADAPHEAEMVTRRWSWPGPGWKARLQLPLGRAPDRACQPLPDPGRRLLRIHRSARTPARREEAQARPQVEMGLFPP
jgi:hypothetical protein